MFDKMSRLAERTAVDLSRRAFLTRLGLGALAFATFVGEAAAGHKKPPPPQCILNGGCCGGSAWPYYNPATPDLCYYSATCSAPGYACVHSTACCGGTGYCGGSTCYADICHTPC